MNTPTHRCDQGATRRFLSRALTQKKAVYRLLRHIPSTERQHAAAVYGDKHDTVVPRSAAAPRQNAAVFGLKLILWLTTVCGTFLFCSRDSWAAEASSSSSQVAISGGQVAFYILALFTILGAVGTITRRNPLVAALCLIWTLFCSAGLYLLQNATFMAVIQVLVYAGAIMVLFVLVIMSVEHPEREELGLLRNTGSKIIGVAALGYLLFRLYSALIGSPQLGPSATSATMEPLGDYGQITAVGRLLFSDYLFPFEAISILLLVAIVGAVVVSRSRAGQDQEAEAEKMS